MEYSCITPLPEGAGNIAAHPLMVDHVAGDYRLAANSPCIDAGIVQPWMTGEDDIAGAPRVSGSTVDMCAYDRASSPLRKTQ